METNILVNYFKTNINYLNLLPIYNVLGEFKDDKINGNGTLNYSNSKGKYEGSFNDGLREGTGTLFYDGNKYVGKLTFLSILF